MDTYLKFHNDIYIYIYIYFNLYLSPFLITLHQAQYMTIEREAVSLGLFDIDHK